MQPDLLANPAAAEPRYDELALAPGVPRAHWRRFSEVLQQTRAEALAERVGLDLHDLLWDGIHSSFFQRLIGLSTTHFGMSTPVINEERQAQIGRAHV